MADIAELMRGALEAFRPPEKLTLSSGLIVMRSCLLNRVLRRQVAHAAVSEGMMDAVTDPAVEQITVMKSARVGHQDDQPRDWLSRPQDACPIMVVQPTVEDAQGYSKEEIAPMLRDTPCLTGLVSESKAKDGNNTILQKNFPAARCR